MSQRTAGPDERVVVIGTGGHAAVVIDILRALGRTVVAAVDSDPARIGGSILGVPITGPDTRLRELRAEGIRQALVAVGDNHLRRRLSSEVVRAGFVLGSAVHPSAWISPHAELGDGAVIMPGGVVNARTRIGKGVIVNTGASIDHDCVLGAFVHVAPGAHLGGGVTCGDDVLVGIGASVILGVTIGGGAVIGAGAAVVENVAPGTTVVGVPARPIGRSG